MEIILTDVSYKNSLNDINITIASGIILGIYPNTLLTKLIVGELVPTNGSILYDNNLIDNSITVSNLDFESINFFTSKVSDEINYYLKNSNHNDYLKKYFDILGFSKDFLKRPISTLSTSELYLFNFYLKLINDSKILVINDIPGIIDRNNLNKIKEILILLKNRDKLIILNSKNIDLLYRFTDQTILVKEKVIEYDDTRDVFTEVDTLIKNNIDLPTLIKITYLAKKEKGIKIFYHTDVRDIIKDIYKHV